jgi:membrane protein DedA with SNARE-associated domain
MKWKRSDIVKWGISGLFAISAIAVASLTVGRDIYYGSTDKGLLSFAIVSLSGYLFFLFIPVELAFIYYLGTDVNIWLLNLVAISTAMVSQSADYLIGYLFSSTIIERFIGVHRYEKAEDKIRKYGNIAIFMFNALPLSSPVISLAAGMLKHRVRDAILYTVSGLVVKHLVLTLIFMW